MSKTELLMGNEAAALGAWRAGVTVASGYPGTPSTETLEYIAKKFGHEIHVEWSVNEKSALELAAGASYAGARTLVTMKQVGLNVAADPIMSLRYVGLTGGMVVYVADDPGPISSQTEQDTRTFGMFSKIPVFDPSSPEEALDMMADAYELSEKYSTPVIMRPTTRICHANAAIDTDGPRQQHEASGFVRDGKRVIFPRTSFLAHNRIEDECDRLHAELSDYRYNYVYNKKSDSRRGLASGGVSFAYTREAMELTGADCPVLKISTPFPFPEKLALEYLKSVDEVMVCEELDPYIERELIYICGRYGLKTKITGKGTHVIPRAGELSADIIADALEKYIGLAPRASVKLPSPPELPVRPPVLCAGCPHRGAFYAVKRAMRTRSEKAVFCGDIGCYTLGNAKPLDMVDTCLCMGAGITVAQGIGWADPGTVTFSFTGDSTFFHTGIPGIVNAVYNGARLVAVILDNSTTAMTGHQPNPSTGFAANGEVAQKISIEDVLHACGVKNVFTADPLDLEASVETVDKAVDSGGVSAVIFRSPCISIKSYKPAPAFKVDAEKCVGCRVCVKEIGCPAIVGSGKGNKVEIDASLCTGCGLCSQLCPTHAIGGGQNE